MKPTCHACGGELVLVRIGPTYAWECSRKCRPGIETGVPVSVEITRFEQDAVRKGKLYPAAFAAPLSGSDVLAAKVFAAQILYHFIECTWGGCYNSIHRFFLIPHLDCPSAVDYVLKSEVIRADADGIVGTSGARIYPELLSRLRSVASPKIQQYLLETFPGARCT